MEKRIKSNGFGYKAKNPENYKKVSGPYRHKNEQGGGAGSELESDSQRVEMSTEEEQRSGVKILHYQG